MPHKRASVAGGRTVQSPQRRPEPPERIFSRVFEALKPQAASPVFDVCFRRYASMRSNIRFDEDSGRILVNLSDLIDSAPAEAMEGLAVVLICKLYEIPIPSRARKAYARWANSQATESEILRIRRERSREHSLPPDGVARDLNSVFDILNDRYFGAELRKPALGWSPQPARRRLGHYDPAHDSIVISRIFDDLSVPLLALEFVLYHEMLHLKHPVVRRGSRRLVHTRDFRVDERQFDGYDEAQNILRSLGRAGSGWSRRQREM